MNSSLGDIILDDSWIDALINISKLTIGSSNSTTEFYIGDNWDLSAYNFPVEIYAGSITTGDIIAGANPLTLVANTGNITLTSGSLSSSASGQAIVLQASNGNFINLSTAADALSTPNGNFTLTTSNPLGDVYGERPRPQYRYGTPQAGDTGNFVYYSYTPTLTIQAADQNFVYGETFDGGAWTISGLVNGDTLADVLAGTPTLAALFQDVGSYTGGLQLAPGSLTSLVGYDIQLLPGDLTITPRPLTVTAQAASRAYGSTGSNLTYTASGLVNGDSLTGSLSSPASVWSPVGQYALQQGSLTAGSNYRLTFISDTLTITPAALTLQVHNAARAAGQLNPAFSYSLTGLLGPDTADVVSGVALNTAATRSSAVGSYAITASGGVARNYVISGWQPGRLEVTLPSATTLATELGVSLTQLSTPALTWQAVLSKRPQTPTEAAGLDLRQSFSGWLYDPYRERYALGTVDDALEAQLLAAEAQRTPNSPPPRISYFKRFITDFWGHLRRQQ